MKNFAILFAVLLLAAIILLPAFGNGKYNLSKPVVADGYPLPPFPPSSITVATTDTLVADGYPLPPFPPNSSAIKTNDTLVVDGYPLPPFPPSGKVAVAV